MRGGDTRRERERIGPGDSVLIVGAGGGVGIHGVQMAKLINRVMPLYPPLAKSARISGVVHLIGIISKDGTIRNLQVVSGHPLLTKAAVDAVSQWVYKPTLLNNEAVEVIAPIDVNFTLSQ